MGINSGWQEITTGERASEQFDFQGGRMAYAVTGTASDTPNWNVRFLIGNGFQKFDAAQLDRSRPGRTGHFPAGRYQLFCDTNTAADFTPVRLFWAYCPESLQDAALH